MRGTFINDNSLSLSPRDVVTMFTAMVMNFINSLMYKWDGLFITRTWSLKGFTNRFVQASKGPLQLLFLNVDYVYMLILLLSFGDESMRMRPILNFRFYVAPSHHAHLSLSCQSLFVQVHGFI